MWVVDQVVGVTPVKEKEKEEGLDRKNLILQHSFKLFNQFKLSENQHHGTKIVSSFRVQQLGYLSIRLSAVKNMHFLNHHSPLRELHRYTSAHMLTEQLLHGFCGPLFLRSNLEGACQRDELVPITVASLGAISSTHPLSPPLLILNSPFSFPLTDLDGSPNLHS